MAVAINDGKSVSLDGVLLDAWLTDLEIVETASLFDVSTQGVANKVMARGKPSYKFTATFLQDTAALAVDATIRANLSGSFAGIFKDKGAANTYTGPVTMGDYTVAASGSDGFGEITCVFEPSGVIVIT